MRVKPMLFLGVVILVLLGMHYAFFGSIIRFFGISRPGVKIVLYIMMILLAFSFISALMLLRQHKSFWTVGYYKFAATWLGFLIHFLAAVAIIWLIIFTARMLGQPISKPVVAAVTLTAFGGWALLGMWNAFHPRVHRIDLAINHLPQNWRGKTLVQLSDVHLGWFHGPGYARRLVEQVNALHPDVILITGDLLDGMGGDFEQFIAPLNRLRAKQGIFFITGNHEYYVGIKKALAIISRINLRILNNECVNVNGLEIVGVGYPGIPGIEAIKNLRPKTEKTARILLFHTPTNMRKNSGSRTRRHFSLYWTPDTSYALNKQVQADIQLSGHTHHGQIFPLNFLTRLLYSGHDYGFSYDGNFRLYTTCGTGSWGPPMRTPIRPEIVLFTLVQKADS